MERFLFHLGGLLLSAAVVWSCASDDLPTGDDDAAPDAPRPDTWTWQAVAGTRCGSGTETGIAVNPHRESDTLTVFLEGGGACWTGAMCSATDPPLAYNLDGYDAETFVADVVGGVSVPDYQIFDRTDPANPFGRDSFVFIPYCTGDVHSGSNVQQYDNEDGSGLTVHHVGFDNVGLDLARIHELFPEVRRVVLVGTSGGGVGAVFNFPQFRATWPEARAHLIDDAGVILPGSGSHALYAAQDAAWRNVANLPEDCSECAAAEGGPSRLFAHLAKQQDFSGALISTNHDSVAAFYYALPPASQDNAGCETGGRCEFEEQLAELVTRTFAPAAPGRVRAFIPVATTHGFLPNRFKSSSDGVLLEAFLGAQLADDPSWSDAIEPTW